VSEINLTCPMRQIVITSFLMLLLNDALSQDYMDVITKKSCSCLGEISDTLKTDQYNMALGVCMIEAAMPYKKQIKKNFDIDLDKIDTEGAKLGRVIGLKMASVCPDALVKITQKSKVKADPAKATQISNGTVTKIENDFFVTISLKDDTGKITKYYWLTFVDSEFDLPNSYSTFIGKSLSLNYEALEFFDPRLSEYRQFFIIKSLRLLD
jgi:hypothetical protein